MKHIFGLFLFSLITYTALGQRLAVKTNLLYDATATINLGAELGLCKKTSLDISGNYNNWSFSDNKQWKHWMVQPEFRYWLCERFNGHFFGVHALVGQFNFNHVKFPFGLYPDLQDYNYQGDFYGGGISYGYQWILGNHWGLEASLGGGYLFVKYNKYPCVTCGKLLESDDENYWGLTKIGISIIYFIF